MSAVQRFPLNVRRAFEELREIQKLRFKAKMEGRFLNGNDIVKFLNSDSTVLQQFAGNIGIENILENVYLFMENAHGLRTVMLPCHQILHYSCVDTTITFDLQEFYAEKCILELNKIEQVDMIISKVKPSPQPRANTYHNDGNV